MPAYNQMIEQAVAAEAEGLVLIHDDVRLNDTDVCEKLRSLFDDPTVAIVALLGPRHATSAAWWWSKPSIGFLVDHCTEDGSKRTLQGTPGAGVHEVDTVDGVFLALSPWALRNLSFDQGAYPPFHGYDAEIAPRRDTPRCGS